MKRGLRYIIAVLLAGSLGIWFFPLLDMSIIELSLMDVMKTGLGFYSGSAEAELLYGSVQTYLSACAWGIAGAALLVLVEAFLTAVLDGKKGYIVSLISSILNGIAGVLLFVLLWLGIEEVRESTILFLAGDIISLSFVPLAAWLAVCVLILILSIVGMKLCSPRKHDTQEEIYIEQISRLKQERIPEAEPAFRQSMPLAQEWGRPQQKAVQKPVQQDARKPAQKFGSVKPAQSVQEERFGGAVLGVSGMFAGKAYPLEKMTEVFFREENGKILITPYEAEDYLAGVYYIGQYGEYCVEPAEWMTVFLESGQPLGKGRKYYLPRGTNIYFRRKENQFILA